MEPYSDAKHFSPQLLKTLRDFNIECFDANPNKQMAQALKKTVLKGGKRLRPMLTFLMGEFFGLTYEQLYSYAKAIEFVHSASLAHDDVIDEASIRRGIDTLNASHSNKHAILAGDFLLADVLETLSQLGNLEVVKETAKVIKQLAQGEWKQMENSSNIDITYSDVEEVAFLKTASVLRWCCAVPAIISGANEQLINQAKSFGENLGIGFQLVDDILDFQKGTGKEVSIDLKNKLINSVAFHLFKNNPKLRDNFFTDKKVNYTEAELNYAIMQVKQVANKHVQHCQELLQSMSEKIKDDLKVINHSKNSLEYLLELLISRKF